MGLRIAPNPPHVLTPRPAEMDRIRREYGPSVASGQCPTCGGTGTFKWYDKDGKTVVDWECDCSEQITLHRWFLSHGIRLLYQRLAWKDLTGVTPEAMKMVSKWLGGIDAYATNNGQSIWMSGSRGAGKTMIASLLQRTMLQRGINCQQVDSQLLGSLMSNWRDDDAKEWWIRSVRAAPVLVLDDLGRERGHEEWVQARLVDLSRFRIQAMLPTIITGNFTKDQALARYGPEFVDILEQADHYEFVLGEAQHRAMNEVLKERRESGLSAPIVFG